MKTITFESNYSAFAYRMTAEVGDEVNEATTALCVEGIANICYRTAGSNVDKALGVKSKKNGGMGRDGLSYDANLGETINAAVSAKITELENAEGSRLKGLKLSFAVTGEHIKGEGSETQTKEAIALWVRVQALPAEQFEATMKVLKLDEDYDDDKGIMACKRLLTEQKQAAAKAAEAETMRKLGMEVK